MKLAIVFSCLLSTASAFVAPSVKNQATSALASAFENEVGVVAPTGFFDPLGISDSWDAETFSRYQNGEIKNGRVAMLGVLGYVVPEVFRFPGEIYPGLKFADVPNGLGALKVIPGSFWVALFFCIGTVDFLTYEKYGFNEYQDLGMDEETFATRKQNEISNGRLAMLAFMELLRHDITMDAGDPMITGLPFLYE
mmetsp:Transcript_18282/g.33142  ORF Transcript_18282/g.33142 Transcript_18282/m.33142 type:complete len:195 (+) Transcript_18282:145-729(+)